MRARLAIFEGDLSAAEECYVRRAGRPELAVNMYKMFNKWTEAIALAERTDRASVASLRQQHMDYLTSTGKRIVLEYNLLMFIIYYHVSWTLNLGAWV